jgi:hypothetical protein
LPPEACSRSFSAGYVVGPIGAALRPQVSTALEVAWLQGPDREGAAMEADDAMAALLAGYLSDEEDAEAEHYGLPDEQVSQLSQRSMPSTSTAAAAFDMAMYSDDSDDEEVWEVVAVLNEQGERRRSTK